MKQVIKEVANNDVSSKIIIRSNISIKIIFHVAISEMPHGESIISANVHSIAVKFILHQYL